MILVFGGAYNGKLDWVKSKFNIKEDEIHFCNGEEIDFSKKAICGLHKLTYNCVIEKKNSLEFVKENLYKLENKIIIVDEISSGIVPLKKEERIWRDDTGQCIQYLSKKSSEIYRVFCGIPTVIKYE